MTTEAPGRLASTEASFTEHVVLCLVAEQETTHGFAVARITGPNGPLGRVYRIPRPIVYRALDRLCAMGLVVPVRVEPGDRGPKRTLLSVTAAGRKLVDGWLQAPVQHVRDVRTELLAKLALLNRLGVDPSSLLDKQYQALAPIVAGLADQRAQAEGFDRTLATWRHECTASALRFVEEVQASVLEA